MGKIDTLQKYIDACDEKETIRMINMNLFSKYLVFMIMKLKIFIVD